MRVDTEDETFSFFYCLFVFASGIHASGMRPVCISLWSLSIFVAILVMGIFCLLMLIRHLFLFSFCLCTHFQVLLSAFKIVLQLSVFIAPLSSAGSIWPSCILLCFVFKTSCWFASLGVFAIVKRIDLLIRNVNSPFKQRFWTFEVSWVLFG